MSQSGPLSRPVNDRFGASSTTLVIGLTLTPEDAAVAYTESPPVSSSDFVLAARVTEAADGMPGDLRLARPTFVVRDSGNAIVQPFQHVAVAADGTSQVSLTGLARGTYSVTASIEPDGFYTSTGATANVTVTDGTGPPLPSQCPGPSNTYNIIMGTIGNETLGGTTGNDYIIGTGGNDCVVTGDGNDNVTTSGSNDVILAGGGNNSIEPGSGGETSDTGAGNNTITAGADNDTITTGSGNDVIDGGSGFDICRPGTGSNLVRNCGG